MNIVPLQTKEYAQHVVDYLNQKDIGKECVTFLQENILNKKHQSQLAVYNPDVIVTYHFDGRHGSFKQTRKVSLQEYLVILAIDPTLYFYDMVGKHSEVECNASDFESRWATDKDRNVCEWNAMEEGCSDQSETILEQLEEKADAIMKEHGPFFWACGLVLLDEMVVDMQTEFASLLESASFPVAVTFNDVYEAGNRNIWSRKLPARGIMVDLKLVFESPQEAAATILNRPDVTIKRGEPVGHAYVALRDEVVSLKKKKYTYKQLKDKTRIDVSYGDFPLKRTRSWEDLLEAIHNDTRPRDDMKDCLRVGESALKKRKNVSK